MPFSNELQNNLLLQSKRDLSHSGAYGMEVIADTALHQSNWSRIVVIVDAVFTTLTGNTTVTLPKTFLAGNTIDGQWTDIQLTSGEIQAYKEG